MIEPGMIPLVLQLVREERLHLTAFAFQWQLKIGYCAAAELLAEVKHLLAQAEEEEKHDATMGIGGC